jgi:hypothetical protein
VTVVASLALIGLGLIGAWRWWLEPRRAAAAEANADLPVELRRATRASLAEQGLELALADRAIPGEALRWRAPGECVEVYRIRVDDRYRDASVATFLGRAETHAIHYLAIAGDPLRVPQHARDPGADDGPSPVLGVLFEAEEPARVRELWWGRESVGPSAPDFACRRRDWDPVEDALALAWPWLPGTDTRVGEGWRGAPVEGRCHETVCVEPDGSFGHAVPCRARPWAEQLVGAEGSLALIRGDWDDGHDPSRPEIGILTSRVLVVDEGRPLYARVVIDQRWAGVRRELSLVRVDDCGSRTLAAGPGETTRVEETRARFREQFRARLPRPADP